MSDKQRLLDGVSPKILAGRISFLLALIGALAVYFVADKSQELNLLYAVVFFIAFFLLSFLLFRFSLEKFIEDKLAVIYQTIHQLKRNPGAKTQPDSKSGDALTKVNEEVLDWYLDNQKEIERLTEMEQYRREFIGNVSHELKTPVFNIQGYLLTLLEGGLEDKSINRKFLERAEKSVEKLIKLLNELDMIIRLDTGGLRLNMQRVDLVEIVKEVVESVELKAEKKNIKIKVNRKNMDSLWVMADEDKITQVITNLIINSLKYGKKDGKTTISFRDMKNKVLLEIKDDGIGIREEEINRIFDRFFRTDLARSVDQKGFGLGLSIVKHIIEAHGQAIHVNSTLDEGSTFSFTLDKAGKK